MYEVLRASLMIGAVAIASWGTAQADIYKYVDSSGNVYFTDKPLQGGRYKLEWQREARKLVRQTYQSGLSARGRVIRGQSTAMSKSQAQRRSTYNELIHANARRYGLSPGLLHAVIRAESAYNPSAVSRAGAQGLMQLMPGTAARYGVRDSFDPVQNIRGGAAYLRDLLDMFDQDVKLALAGYNAGEGAVLKHGRKIPPYTETQNYVRKVLQYYSAERPSSIAMSVR